MKSIFFYKELTAAEVGNTGTHEIYVRLPNNFDYETFFVNSAVPNGSVIEVNFTATDTTAGGNESVQLRFVFFMNSNQEKRIPSLKSLFESHNVEEGDIVSLESRFSGSSVSYYIHFYKKGEITISPSSIYFTRIDEKNRKDDTKTNELALQQIFYGAPGTGKSFTINRDTKGEDVIRTTFHPDTDYSSFVGAYKPTTIEEPVMTVIGTKLVPVENAKPEKKIIYEFVSQAFLQAYVGAWRKYAEAEQEEPKKQFLVIEEINRGNCAQIFGDLFQLLDRNSAGFSDYPITADADMKKQLQHLFEGYDIEESERENINALYEGQGDVVGKVLNGDILLLPNNMYIWATMNTSDQSLFPIDSAFKRRWDWKYMKIKDEEKSWKVDIDIEKKGDYNNKETEKLDWWLFISKVNTIIASMTSSADKQLGYFFCKPTKTNKEETEPTLITAETFVSKVIFYLWNDVFKDYGFEDASLFRFKGYNNGKEIEKDLTFPDFYKENNNEVNIERLKDFVGRVMNWSAKNDNNE